MNWKKPATLVLASIALTLNGLGLAQADFNYVTNGSFSTSGPVGELGNANYGFYTGTTVAGWTSQLSSTSGSGGLGYNFLFNPTNTAATGSPTNNADSSSIDGTNHAVGGSPGQYGTLALWGPGNNAALIAAGFTSLASPDGGNFIGGDGDVAQGAITQSISGLVVGHTYSVSFDWAAAQQYKPNMSVATGNPQAASYSSGQVSLGGQTKSTNTVNIAAQGFSGWMQTTLTFQADSTTDTLSFLSVGGPSGAPPFALLDGVAMYSVPEPSSLVLMGVGLVGFVGVGLRRRARARATVG